jgi:PAS domain S-box-containing protein
VLDDQGRVVVDSAAGNIGASLADREYFRVYQERADTEFFVGPVVRSRTTGAWLVSATRPLRDAGGKIKWIVVAAVEPTYFEQIWKGVGLGPGGAVALFNRDGRLMVRSPSDNAYVGVDFSGEPLFSQLIPAAPQGVYSNTSRVDGRERMSAYSVLSPYPELVVTVGSPYEEMLASWRGFALLTGLVWLIAVLTALALAWQLDRQRRRRARGAARFGQLAQAMPQIVFIADAAGQVRFINERWTESTGYASDAALGSGWTRLIHPDDRQSAIETLRSAMKAGRLAEHEHRVLYADGSYRWQLVRAVPERDAAGKVVTWYGTSTDIDELKRAQGQLKDQAGMLIVAGQLARMGGWAIDVPGEVITWSDEASDILDMPPGSTPTLDEIVLLLSPRSRDRTIRAVRTCIEEGTVFDVEVEMVTATGRPIWVRSIGRPVRDAAGKVVRIEGAQQDITERVRLLEEVRELNASLEEKVAQRTGELARQEALFRTLAEQAPMPIWTVDPRGGATFFSRAWYEMVGGAPPQWHGTEWLAVVHPDDVAGMTANWKESRRTASVYQGTRRLRAADGSWRTTSYRATPVFGVDGDIEFWVGVDADITALVAHEEALRLANEQLEAFSYSVSHDLQSPLQRVASFAQLLERELGTSMADKAAHYLSRIRANTDYMTQLIDGLLSLAHVARLDMVRATVNLSTMATEILERLHTEHPARMVQWKVQPGLAVLGDSRLMRSVMENLLGNAWKFTSRQAQARIEFGWGESGEYFVRDNGAGFDMAYAGKLFGAFQRLHTEDEFPGTGIGLATVARAIGRQGGTVRAEAALGEGATFWFTLARAR